MRNMEDLTTLLGQVMNLAGDALDFILKNPVLAIPLVVGIAGSLFGLVRRARRV